MFLCRNVVGRRFTVMRIHADTHSDDIRVDTKVFPISTAHIEQHTCRWERGQEVANTRPRGVTGAAEVGGDGIVHPVHILLLQTGCIRGATRKRWRRWRRGRGSSLTVTGRGEGWRVREEINRVTYEYRG